jgi:hypothetical protein
MGIALAGIGASAAGSILGQKLQGTDEGNLSSQVNVPDTISQMNSLLDTALSNALGTSTNATNSAIGEENSSLGQTTNILNSANTAANSALASGVNTGTAENQALNAPYLGAGYQALDAYMGNLGLATPVGGSGALESNLYNAAQLSPTWSNYLTAANSAGVNPYSSTLAAAPSLSNYTSAITPAQINAYIAQNITPMNGTDPGFGTYTGVGAVNNATSFTNVPQLASDPSGMYGTASELGSYFGADDASNPIVAYLAAQNPAYQAAQSNYQNYSTAFNNLGTALGSSGATPAALAQSLAYNSGNTSGVK